MRKYIVFRAERRSPNWKERKFQHTQALTDILADWEVTRVETYTPDVPPPHSQYDIVVICHCKYNPMNAPLKPMPERQISVDSFGGDKEAYEQWLKSQKEPVEV